MKRFNTFKPEIRAAAEQLPVGGYICKILNAEEISYSWGSVLVLSFDICEGEHKDFYKNQFNNQVGENKKWKGTFRVNVPKDDGSEKDGWTAKTFNHVIGVIEDANPGYRFEFDETTLKNKLIGLAFREEEWAYDGKTGWAVRAFRAIPVGDVKDGKFGKLDPKPLKNKPVEAISGFEPIDDEEPLPWE